MPFQPRPSYTYNDLGLMPKDKSTVASRSGDDVDPSMDFLGLGLELPILAAPMETVVGERLAGEMRRLGGVAILPRYKDFQRLYDTINRMGDLYDRYDWIIPSVPSGSMGIEQAEIFWKMGVRIVCIDVANGFAQNVEDTIRAIRKSIPEIKIVTGNVASIEGYRFMANLEVDAVRVGIGGGSVCTTSVATGIGVGQASLVRMISQHRFPHDDVKWPLIIADGGIKTPGDVVKAIALGADLVMAGGVFAGSEEAPGRVLKIGNQKFKHLAGQASMFIKGQSEYVEGADKVVPYTGALEKTWKAFDQGIRSGMSYLNRKTLSLLRELDDSYFYYLSDAAKAERRVHA